MLAMRGALATLAVVVDVAVQCCLVMPFRNEASSLAPVLDSLAQQDVDWSRFRFIGVDSASRDASGALVQAWLGRHGIRGEVVRVDRPGIPRALNAGIARVERGEAVVRLDAHTTYAPGYLRTLLHALDELGEDVWWVGGPQHPAPLNGAGFGHALVRALMTNRMGLGGAAWRHAKTPRPVDSVYLGVFRPGVLERVGGFDDAWEANEDAELAARIRAAGGRIWYVPARCDYHITRVPVATLRQWSRYGFWRAHTMLRHPSTVRPRHLAPPLALLVAVTLALSPARAALLPLGAAFAALVVRSRERDERIAVTLATLLYFPCTHLAFAGGMAAGAVAATLKRLRGPAKVRRAPG
ncbi:MAG TPA: glycosyltransferase [Candidatus Acidoferrum sp.]|nr:glycosyltransferase [Candidatus Acidoferrum sp.]